MKEYTFENQEIDGKNAVILCLKDFPDIKFKFKSIRFGPVDDEQQVPVLFDIDLIGENQSFPEDPEFGNQVSQILLDLLTKMAGRKYEIAKSIG